MIELLRCSIETRKKVRGTRIETLRLAEKAWGTDIGVGERTPIGSGELWGTLGNSSETRPKGMWGLGNSGELWGRSPDPKP